MPIIHYDSGVSQEQIAAGTIGQVYLIPHRRGAGITAIPDAGGTMRVFKSTSPISAIESDASDGSLSYANLIAGTQPNRSEWMLWAPGAVTETANQGPIESAGDVAIVATATTQGGRLEVAR